MFTRRRTLLIGALVGLSALALGGAVYAYGYHFLRVGCPSQEEADRPRTSEEVRATFDENDLPLTEIARPTGLPRATRVFRHEADEATLFVFVCPSRCPAEATDRASAMASGQQTRRGISFANVFIRLTGGDAGASQRLLSRTHDVVDRLDGVPPFGDRCYIL